MIEYLDFFVNNFMGRPVVLSKASIRCDFVMSLVSHMCFIFIKRACFGQIKSFLLEIFVADDILSNHCFST